MYYVMPFYNFENNFQNNSKVYSYNILNTQIVYTIPYPHFIHRTSGTILNVMTFYDMFIL